MLQQPEYFIVAVYEKRWYKMQKNVKSKSNVQGPHKYFWETSGSRL